MKVIYENQIKSFGENATEFQDMNMVILFGNNAPAEIRDYCYCVDVSPLHGAITAGQILKINDTEFTITAVGSEAPVTLARLGHCTINFNGQKEVELPGTIYVENKPLPAITIGSTIQILGE